MFGHWLRLADGRGWQLLFPAVVVALVLLVQLAWQYRTRSLRRWKAALDAYAAREIARERVGNDLRR
jgi:hypothetical protein